MPNLRKDIDLYLQKLLALQFEASSNISHKPTKGGVREKFIKQVVKSEIPDVTLVSGTPKVHFSPHNPGVPNSLQPGLTAGGEQLSSPKLVPGAKKTGDR